MWDVTPSNPLPHPLSPPLIQRLCGLTDLFRFNSSCVLSAETQVSLERERGEGGRDVIWRGEEERRRGGEEERVKRQQTRQQTKVYTLFFLYYVFSHNCERYTRELTMETSSRMMKKSWALSMSWSRTKILTWRERSEDIVKTDTNTQRY